MITPANKFIADDISFSDVKSDIHGRKMVYCNYQQGKLLLQTPKLKAPNGVKKWRKPDASNNFDDKFELELSLSHPDQLADDDVSLFHQQLAALDHKIKHAILANSKSWLGMNKLDINTLENVLYNPIVRHSLDKDGNQLPYPSRLRVKIDRDIQPDGSPSGLFLSNKRFKSPILVFDSNKQPLPFDESSAESTVSKGSQLISLIELVYISLSKTSISVKWKLVQAKVFPTQSSITSYAMLDDPADYDSSPSHTPLDDSPPPLDDSPSLTPLDDPVDDPVDDLADDLADDLSLDEPHIKPSNKRSNKRSH